MSWEESKFGSLYAIPSRNGLSLPAHKRGYGCKMINMGELFSYPRIMNPEMARVQPSDYEIEKYAVENGDLLFARRSLVLEGAGKCSIVTGCEFPTVFESSIIRVRLNKEISDPLFYFYFFNSQAGTGFIQQIVNQVAVAGIRGSDLEKLKVIYPPLPVQQRIAAILKTYDDLIENSNKRIVLLEKAAEEIYREWFVRMRFPGWEETNFEKGIPDDWNIVELHSVVKLTMGQSPKSEFYNVAGDGLPFHQGVGTYGERFPEHKVFCSVDGRKANKGDILFSVRAPVGRLNIANCEMIIGRGLAAMRHKDNKNSYLFYLLKTIFSVEDLIGNGAIFASVSKNELEKFKFLSPQKSLIDKFDDVASNIDKQIENLYASNSKLIKTRDLLLSRLISGKLSVEELDIHFPPNMVID